MGQGLEVRYGSAEEKAADRMLAEVQRLLDLNRAERRRLGVKHRRVDLLRAREAAELVRDSR